MYIKLTNGIPENYSIGKLRRDNPNVSFPKKPSDEVLRSFDVYPYTVQDDPAYDNRTQTVITGDFAQVDGSWVQTKAVQQKTAEEIAEYDQIMVSRVKREAQRRILEILPEWKQRNLTARAAELSIKGVDNWTLEETSEYEAGQAIWNQIKLVREKSDALESMDPIPNDFAEDSYWAV